MKKGKKFLGYILFFAALFVLSFVLHNNVSAVEDSQKPYQNILNINSSSEVLHKVIWREDIYDPSLKAKVNVIKIDDSYFAGISGPEKAVLGYLA